MECHLNCDLSRNRLAILHSRFKFPRLDSIDRFFIQPFPKGCQHFNIARIAVGADDQGNYACALELGFSRLLCICGDPLNKSLVGVEHRLPTACVGWP
jgi:hypothetical protein